MLGNGICEQECISAGCYYDSGDCITAENPVSVYIYPGGIGRAVGTESEPLASIQSAMQQLWAPFTVIYLMQGTHMLEFAGGNESAILTKTVKLTSLLCSASLNPFCTHDPALVQLTRDRVTWSITGCFSIENVRFMGNFPLKPSCTLPQCLYCPTITIEDGESVSDRGEEVQNYAEQSICDAYKDTALIRVSPGAQLFLQSVSFKLIRHQLLSLIASDCGALSFSDVTFSAIIPQRKGLLSAVITHIGRAESPQITCGSFNFTDGLVDLLNDGYEYNSGKPFSGFLSADQIQWVSLRNVKFHMNNILGKWKDLTALLYIQTAQLIEIKDCLFESTLANGATLLVNNNGLDTVSVILEDTDFNSNYGNEIVQLTITAISMLLNLTHCDFRENISQDSIIGIYGEEQLQGLAKVLVTDLSAAQNLARNFISVNTSASVNISHSDFIGNGDIPDLLDRILNIYIASASSYMLVTPVVRWPVCIGTILLKDVRDYSLDYVLFSACNCAFGSPGLTHIGSPHSIHLSHITFSHNIGEELIAVEPAEDLTLTSLSFLNNTSLRTGQAVCLRFSASQAVSISVLDSDFIANQGFQNTIAMVTGIRNFTLVNVVVTNNTARGTSAGVALYPYTAEDSYFQVVNCSFRDNVGSSYGVLLVTDPFGTALSKAYKLEFTVRNTTFERNFAKIGGSCITISGSVFLSTASIMTRVSFIENVCNDGGAAINSHYLAGAIHLNFCIFKGNKGATGAAIWSTHQGESTYLYINDCEFEGNQGDSVMAVTAIGSQLVTEGISFKGSMGTAVLIYQGIWQDRNSLYINNKGVDAGAMLFSTSAKGALFNATISDNFAGNQGGGLTVWISSTVACSDCIFRNNSCRLRGGALFLEEKSNFNCTNVTFLENKSRDRGSVLFALLSNFGCISCLFERNYAAEFAAVFIMGAEAYLEKTNFTDNQASRRSPGIMLSLASLIVLDCSFANHTGDLGSFITANDQSYLYISSSKFQSGHAKTHGGCFYLSVNSTIIVEKTDIFDCSAQETGSIIRGRTGTVVFRQVTIRNVTSHLSSGAIALAEGSLDLEIDCAGMIGSAVSVSSSVVLVQRSLFLGLNAFNGAAISVSDCSLVIVRYSEFIGGLAKRGGAIYAYSSGSSLSNQVTIYENCTFTGNKAVNGGSIYSDSVDVYVRNCYFSNNSASPAYYSSAEILLRGVGAALYLVNPNIVVGAYQVISNVFEDNAASNMGAALYWFDTYPVFENNTVHGNIAPYGSEIASFPIKLSNLNPNNSLLNYQNQENPPLLLTLTQVCSGQTYDGSIRIALVDQYDKIVTVDSSSSANLQIIEKNSSALTGNIKAEAVNGVFELKDVVFIGQPKSIQHFLIVTNGVNPYLKTFTSDPHDYYQTVKIAVEFRDCQAGESYQGLTCYRCPAGTFSLHPASPCNSCPSHATCLGGFEMVPLPGYWRPDPLQNLFFACPNPDSCLGSPNPESISLAGTCALGYSGNLCSVCVEGYSRQGRDVCSKCPGFTSNMIVSALVILGALLLLALAIAISVRGANKPRSQLAIYLKIFMNYLQMIVVAASLSLSWPGLVRLFLNGQETVGSMAEQLFSFDCITQEFSPEHVYNTKLIAVSLLPAVLILLSAIVWGIIAICIKQTAIRHKLISSTVMIIFIIHPSLTKLMLADFSCREILPGELWLTTDLSQRCWDSTHIREVLTIVLPGLIVWGFGLPSLALGFLIKYRTKLTDKVVNLEFSFLFKGYTEKWFYWEFVILYRKVALICSAVFFNSVSTMVQALSVLAVLLICLFLQLAVKPFITPNFNLLEVKSLLVSLITIYSGLYFEVNSMSQTLNILIFLLILLANAYFLLGWIRAVLPILIETLKQRLNCGKRHYAIRPMPAKYDESLDESSGISKATGTHHMAQSEVRPRQVPGEGVSSVTPPNNTLNLEVEHSVEGDIAEYVASSFREI